MPGESYRIKTIPYVEGDDEVRLIELPEDPAPLHIESMPRKEKGKRFPYKQAIVLEGMSSGGMGKSLYRSLNRIFGIPVNLVYTYEKVIQLTKQKRYSSIIVNYNPSLKNLHEFHRDLNNSIPHLKWTITASLSKSIEKYVLESFAPPLPKVINILDLYDPHNIKRLFNREITGPLSGGLIDLLLLKIDPNGNLTDEETDFIFNELQKRCELLYSNLDQIVLSDKGYTCKKGFTFKDKFIKVDLAQRLKLEYEAYCLDLGDFNCFRPRINLSEFAFSETEDLAIIAMDNVNMYEPAFLKVNQMYGTKFTRHDHEYSIFLMSLFHKEASRHKDKFIPIIYQGVHGLPYLEETCEPYINTSGPGLRRFQKTEIDTKKLIPIIKDYSDEQKVTATTVIHGDWKQDNIVNGYLVDYSTVAISSEVEELAYYLSDSRFRIDLEQFHQYTDQYIQFRSSHDAEFKDRINNGYEETMHKLGGAAFLSQLVLRHCVMNKRDMMDDEKYKQRMYYQQMIHKVVKKGRFV